MTTPNKLFENRKIRNGALLAVVVIVIFGGGLLLLGSREDSGTALATFTVKKGPLTISVLESGTIKAKDQVIIKNEVEGRTSIIYLIDEGTRVQKGDLLVELDASSLLDSKIDQEIAVQNAEASYINAKENLAVVENQAESDKDAARLTLDFAQVDLKKYQEGEYPNQLKDSEARIELAKEELKRAQDTLDWSNKLWEEKYISENEQKADELAVTRCELDLQLAIGNRDLLRDFTYPRQIKQLESDIRQAEMALERTIRKANAAVVQAQAELKAKEAEFKRQQDKLAKIEDQLKKTKLYAPADGLVIYATSAKRGGFRGNQEPLDEGQEVLERQELIYLPIGATSIAEVNVHESSLKKVHPGLPAVVTVDALPGKHFLGRVDFIAPLPDAQSMWMNPDLKVYNTQITLEGEDPTLRTGMSCKAEIIVEQYEDSIFVPVQSVLRVNGQPTVYVAKKSSIEPRVVKTGMDNNRMIRILEGLKEGDRVLLTPPLKEAEARTTAGPASSDSSAPEQSAQMDQEIRNRLNEAQSQSHMPAGPSASPEAGSRSSFSDSPQRGGGRPDFPNMTPEQREELRKRFENMTPEQREQMRQMRQGRQGRQGSQEGRQGDRPPRQESSPGDSQ
jgi:HlyD family secretion protein